MNPVTTLRRLESPTPGNTSLAFDGELLWLGSVETNRLYGMDPNTWQVRYEYQLRGGVWGLVVAGSTPRVMLGEGEGSFRTIYRFDLESGITDIAKIACPDGGTGSHLGFDGKRLFIGQRDLRRIVALDESGAFESIITLPYRLYGLTVVDGRFYCIATEHPDQPLDEFVLRVDTSNVSPELTKLATLPFDSHGIAHDGIRFWTNDRNAGEVVAFANPDAS